MKSKESELKRLKANRRAVPVLGFTHFEADSSESETERCVLEPSYIQREYRTELRPKISLRSRILKSCAVKSTFIQFPKGPHEPVGFKDSTSKEANPLFSMKSLSKSYEQVHPRDYYGRRTERREVLRPNSQYSPYRIASLNLNCKVPKALFAPSQADRRKSLPYVEQHSFRQLTNRLPRRLSRKQTKQPGKYSAKQLSSIKLVIS